MKNIGMAVLLALFVSSCRNVNTPVVEPAFVDSLITHYSTSLLALTSDSNLQFWKRRMDSLPDNFVNGPEYAAALASQFHFYGDIHNLRKADSLIKRSNEANQEKEPGIFRTLTSFAMLQHQFIEADGFLQKAIQIEGPSIPNLFTEFDVAFERGYYQKAKQLLQPLSVGNSYGYLFRRSKYEHYDGSLDSAISYMMQAADKAGPNKYLRQVALSNAADLCIHKGNIEEAYNLYMQSIKIDAADLHSIMGIGWIALVHDKNDSLAERIFQFVRNHTHSPDVLLKLEQVAEARGDTLLQKKYADQFVLAVTDSMYGKMYSKYLVDLYTTVLHQPSKAVMLAEAEINNRPSPQVYAWYAWSLFCNNEIDKAYTTFKSFVSGMPLEGPELYYMGRMMKGLDKGYNAEEFFKVAFKNKYDLSPAKQRDLQKHLE